MPPSIIVQIFARLFALNWVLGAVAHSVSLILTTERNDLYFTNLSINLISAGIYLVFGVALWIFAPAGSRLITRGNDEACRLNGVSQEHLYTAVLLGLGVYFSLDSLPTVAGWVHYFAIHPSEGGFHMDDEPSYYDLLKCTITLICGIALVVTCRTWSRRLAAESTGNQAAQS